MGTFNDPSFTSRGRGFLATELPRCRIPTTHIENPKPWQTWQVETTDVENRKIIPLPDISTWA